MKNIINYSSYKECNLAVPLVGLMYVQFHHYRPLLLAVFSDELVTYITNATKHLIFPVLDGFVVYNLRFKLHFTYLYRAVSIDIARCLYISDANHTILISIIYCEFISC